MDNHQNQQVAAQSEQLCGNVEHITFHSEESGFCVLRVKVKGHRDLVTVVGNAANITAGEYVECFGTWNNNPKHGLQFKAKRLQSHPPSSLDGIRKYLASGMVKGIGPHFASKLVDAFGEDVFSVIEQQPDQLRNLEGIGPIRQAKICQAWDDQKAVRDIMVFLHSHGVGTARAVRIYKTYGEHAVQTVSENPYRLALDIWGIGFKTADQLAMNLGIDPQAPIRARAGLHHVLQGFADQGHCAVAKTQLIESAVELLQISQDVITPALKHELEQANLIEESIKDEPAVFLASLHQAECAVAKHLVRLNNSALPWPQIDPDKAIGWMEKRLDIALSNSQNSAVSCALRCKLFIITGGPGVGKTTVINAILCILAKKISRIQLCAPTGRAAKRLAETTGFEAKTIHRLLEFDPKTFAFKHNEEHPLDAQLVVLDETSMVDIGLMQQLLRAIPDNAALILVGDVDQLPSVGPGAVLADLINSHTIACVQLTEIFRQAAESKIVMNAHRINQGQMPLWDDHPDAITDFYFIRAEQEQDIIDKLRRVICQRIPQRFGFNPLTDVQVLSPMNRGGLGARSLNLGLQAALNPNPSIYIERYGSRFQPGDKIIQMVNNYDKDVFNGDIGRIDAINAQEKYIVTVFDNRNIEYDFNELDELALAYAVTIHKSQGSEYPVVVIPLATQHYVLLERNLLYTAVSRGKKLVVIIGQPKALAIAVKNMRAKWRLTHLVSRLQQMLPP